MNTKEQVVNLVTGAIVLISIAFINMYPLVTSDTGAYIGNIYDGLLPRDRPITYSIFLLLSSLRLSLWLTIFIQSLWLSFLIFLFLQIFIDLKKYRFVHLIFIVSLTLFTSVSWYSSQIMADIFSATLWLNIMVILLYKNKNKYLSWLLYFALFATLLMHNSNMLTSLLLVFSLLILSFFYFKPYLKSLKKIFLTTILAIFFLASAHYIKGFGFKLSQTTDVFLVAKLSENGVLKSYLDDNCPNEDLKLCSFKDNLPNHAWDYIWTNNGPFELIGGWENSKTEHHKILKEVFSTPKYLYQFFTKSIVDGFIQFCSYQVGDGLFPNLEPSNAFYQVQKFYRIELKMYENSLQNKANLPFKSFNLIYSIVIILSVLVSLIIFIFKEKNNSKKVFLFLFLSLFLFLFYNAYLTANLANVLARLQSRVLWLLPFICWIYIFNMLVQRNKNCTN